VDINGDTLKLLSNNISDYIYGVAQLNCEQIKSDIKLDEVFVKLVRPFVMFEMKKNEDSIRQDEEVKFFSSIKRRTEQEINYYDSRIIRINKMLQEGKGIEAILRREIESFNLKREQLINNQKNAKLFVTHSLISTNLLQII